MGQAADFTTRLSMAMLPEAAAMLQAAGRLAILVESLAKTHEVAIPLDLTEAISNFRGAAAEVDPIVQRVYLARLSLKEAALDLERCPTSGGYQILRNRVAVTGYSFEMTLEDVEAYVQSLPHD